MNGDADHLLDHHSHMRDLSVSRDRVMDLQPHSPAPRKTPSDDEHAAGLRGESAQVNRAARNSKPRDNPKPSQLRFYSGLWADTLVKAKTFYKFSIHAESDDPFPERNTESLNSAHDCLLEAVALLSEEQIETLDRGASFSHYHSLFTDNVVVVYETHKSGMTSLVSDSYFCYHYY